jgi:hypothetical protein
MSLLPPVVIGPLSVCSSSVRVQGQLAGATVDLFMDGAHVGSGLASWSDQVFPLNAGVTLKAGHSVTATQTSSGQPSPASAPVIVQNKPPVIGSVACETHIYECGQCLWLDGMVPGATVEVTVGGSLRGHGTAPDGTARIGLSPATAPSETLVARQTACGTKGPLTNLPTADNLPGPARQLPPPSVPGPLKACQVAVWVGDAVDGAQVTLTETPAPGFTETGCFDLPGLWFQCPPLTQGSKVSATQNMPGCKELASNASPAITVGPPTPVPPPAVVPPLCAGSVVVRLTHLLPGSTVEIFQGATSLGTGSAPAAIFDFAVPPLTGGGVITARQELCTHWSVDSNQVAVDPQPASIPQPVVEGPLFQCGAAVHVSNLHPGATVGVWSTLLAAPIGHRTIYSTQGDVPVAPLLLAGDQIYALEQGCGRTAKSQSVPVSPLEQPKPPMVLSPVETCMRSVTVTGLVAGAHVEVYVNNVWRGSAIATAATAEVPLSGSLNVGDKIKARQTICGNTTAFGLPEAVVVSSAGFYYLTQHFNTARTGWFPYETTLNVSNVSKLKSFTQDLTFKDPDGTQHPGVVYAQPLYAHHVNIPGLGAHNVVYVSTEDATVFAFDADNNTGTNSSALWQRTLTPYGEQVVLNTDFRGPKGGGCTNIVPFVGSTSTPVIDCASHTMWVVAKTKSVAGGTTTFHTRLYALDISTGADRPGSPVEIEASFPGTASPNDGKGNVQFDRQWQNNRPALLLQNGRIYIGFGSICDWSPGTYHGWVLAYNATTLKQVGAFCTTPNSEPIGNDMGGIWQGGMGLAADPEGFVYFTTGNGDFDANVKGGTNYGDTAVRLAPDFSVSDFFTPSDQDNLRTGDVDFGSGGVLILPDPPAGAAFPKAMVACGKDGKIFLIDRQKMGKYNGPPPGADLVLAVVPLQKGSTKGQPGVWGGPAYFDTGKQQFVYYAGDGGPLTAFVYAGSSLTLSTIGSTTNQSSQTFPHGGTTPVVSSNQSNAGTGIVWALVRPAGAGTLQLVAFDATDLTKPTLFSKPAGPWGTPDGGAYTEPTVIQGKVYVPSQGQLSVFHL